MTLEEFRLTHSELIEHYQFIEHHLEGIYACLSDGKSFGDGMEEVERDTIPQLLNRIRTIQNESGRIVLTEEELKIIEGICKSRNSWCHNCYVDLSFDRKNGGPKNDYDIKKMLRDLSVAQEIRDWLFEKKVSLLPSKR